MVRGENPVTVCIPVFTRTEQLRRCLASIPDGYEILIADDGHFDERREIYRESNARVFYLGYGRGIGAKRRRLSREVDTEYALFLDPDNRFPIKFGRMLSHLRETPHCGGVTGLLDEGTYRDTSAWFFETNGSLIRQRMLGIGSPDFVGQAMLCRTEIFDTYTWDSRFKTCREHLDFFYGHYTRGEWTFDSLSDVIIPHVTMDIDYRAMRNDVERKSPDRQLFEEKCGKRVITI